MNILLKRLRELLSNLLVALASTTITLLLLEIVTRLISPNVGLFDFRNFVTNPVSLIGSGNPGNQYDPELGWVHKTNFRASNFGVYGERINRELKADEPIPPPPANPILALGSSFTFGFGERAEVSWPAQLEQLIHVPVLNVGVSAYSLGQISTLMERLLPLAKPKLVLIHFNSRVIDWERYVVFDGAPKPYYEIADGKLVLRNYPAPAYRPSAEYIGLFRAVLGYSYLIDWTATRLGLEKSWETLQYDKIAAFPTEKTLAIGCRLAMRIEEIGERFHVPVVLVANYVTPELFQGIRTYDLTRNFTACAREIGLPVRDLWDDYNDLRSRSGASALEGLFNTKHFHFTPAGSAFVAERIAAYLRVKFPGQF